MGRCRLALEVSSYRPILLAPHITAPVLYAAATQDSLCPLDGVKAAAAATPNATLITVDTNHFAVYSGEALEFLSGKYVEFFRLAAGLPVQAAAPAEPAGAAAADISALHEPAAEPAAPESAAAEAAADEPAAAAAGEASGEQHSEL